jgi:hypothetical protein
MKFGRKTLALLALMMVAVVAAACGGGGGGDTGSPEGAVEGFINAALGDLDFDAAAEFVCAELQDQVAAEAAGLEEIEASGASIDVGGLTYETVSEDGDNATVSIGGEISVSIEIEGETIEQSLPLDEFAGDGGGEIPVVFEDGEWKVCDTSLLSG